MSKPIVEQAWDLMKLGNSLAMTARALNVDPALLDRALWERMARKSNAQSEIAA